MKESKKSAAQKIADLAKSDEEIAEEKAQPKQEGVLFWHRRRLETSNGPQYFDNPDECPAHASIAEAKFLRIKDPENPTRPLIIHGSRRIKDRMIAAYLILKNKPAAKSAMGKGSKVGALLYDPDEVIGNGIMTRDELKAAAVMSIAPEWYRAPDAPPPNLSGMPESELDKLARENNVKKYDVASTIFDKRARLGDFFRDGQ